MDRFIVGIGRIIPYDKYQEVGVQLGFGLNHVDNVLAGFAAAADRYEQAARSLLIEWKNKHGSGPDQRKELEDILKSLGIELESKVEKLSSGEQISG